MTAAEVAKVAPIAQAVQMRICYCSVFDDCYVQDTRRPGEPSEAVRTCPVPKVPFQDDVIHAPAFQRALAAGMTGADLRKDNK